jgi:hypothetical protein
LPQGIGTRAPDGNNSVSLYGGGNLGRTDRGLDNSTLLGAFYTRTQEELARAAEVQVQYANEATTSGRP